jgi:hypothetical protein
MSDDIRRRPTCEDIVRSQDEYLRSLCSKKVNQLSCRCSGCASDRENPILTSSSDAPLLNTAYNGSGGFLTSGTDAHWQAGIDATGGGPSAITSWSAAYVVANSAWTTSPFNNANWISFYPTNGAQPLERVDAYFRYRFNLASSVNPATFAVKMTFFADNQVAEIFVNGQPQSGLPNGSGLPQQGYPPATDPYNTSGFGPKSGLTITLDNAWRRCDNEIIVYVKSSAGYLGFLAQNAVAAESDPTGCHCDCNCEPAPFPDIRPCITVKWGDSDCDCLETDDVEVLCITICNCYSNVSLAGVTIGQIVVTDLNGNPVPTLPDGTPSIQVIPTGPICFGDIGPCTDKAHPPCVSRELAFYTRGAAANDYRLFFHGICFQVCHEYQAEQCFTVKLCRD